MKYIAKIAALILFAIGLTANAQTNVVEETEVGRQVPFTFELTLGGAGTVTLDGESTFGMDFSLGINPIESLPNIWIGIIQGLYWEPVFSGSTDFYADWSTPIFKDIVYLNTGWSVGSVYDQYDVAFRTGPEISFQYYLTDETFIYLGANYDLWLDQPELDDGFRYSFGLGFNF